MLPLSRNLLTTLIITMILGMLFIGLYPFNYLPENRVSINRDGSGLHFFGRGTAYSTEVGDWPREGPITLELKLKPDRAYNRRIPHILSLCDASGREVLYLGQWKNSLIIRLMEDSHWIQRIKREIGVGDVLNPGIPVHIDLVLEEGNALVYANGHLAEESSRFEFAAAVSRRPIVSTVLGNSSTGDSPWGGEISSFATWNSAISSTAVQGRSEMWGLGKIPGTERNFIKYNFESAESGIVRNEAGTGWNLRVSETLTPLRREFLAMPARKILQERSFYKDAVINLVGFIPLGLALTMFIQGIPLSKYSILNSIFPVLIGGLLSLFIETNQAFLVSRSSSASDLILNVSGSALGVVLFFGFRKWGPTHEG